MSGKCDFLVIGGGVIGMLTARELAAAGASVTVVERGLCGGEASWAGGGIVSPLYPWRYEDPVTALASRAQAAYPTLITALKRETGIDSEFECSGLVMLDAGDEARALDWAARHQCPMQLWTQPGIAERLPRLATGFSRALWMPEVANVRNPRLGQALRESLRLDSRVVLRENTSVKALQMAADGRVNGVEVDGGAQISAGATLICAGAWSADLGRLAGLELPVAPVKGQMLLYRLPERWLQHIVLHEGRYLIPRRDNHLLVGSTLEHKGFDKQCTQEALFSLRESAISILPALAGLPVLRQWAGLRPGAPAGVPLIGALPTVTGLYINAGHYRNGLVLAPASARLMADLLLGRRSLIDPAPYSPRQAHFTPGPVSSVDNAGSGS